MGLFNNYLKEGPGVEKDAPEKHRFFLFFELFGRKFSKLIQLNILYAVTLIPLFLGLIMTIKVNPEIFINGSLSLEMLKKVPVVVISGDIIGMIILVLSAFISGPATAGFTYVIRNFQREEHAWVMSDFLEQFKKNFRQGSIIALLDLVIYATAYVAIVFYSFMVKDWMPEIAGIAPILVAIVCMLSVIYTWMHYYIYVMMVTFKLTIKDIYRNSFLFALGKLPLNIFITLIVGAVILLSVYYTFIGSILAFIITIAFIGYVIIFSVYPTIDKYLLTPVSQIDIDNDDE